MCEDEPSGRGIDVVLGAAVDRADGYDGGIEGRIFAADDRLDGHDEFGGRARWDLC